MKPILEEISKQWDGLMLPFPQVTGLEDRVFLYQVKAQVRSFIVVYEFLDENWNDTPDIMLRNDDMRKIIFMQGFFAAPTTLAIEFKDRMVYLKIKDIAGNYMDYVDPQGFFLPKERFQLLRKKEKAA